MRAAVVTSYDAAPRYGQFTLPEDRGDSEMVVDVVASGLHPRVRSQAAGAHYTSTGQLPLVPGIDGVGRGPDGRLRYFVLPDTLMGAMAERTIVDARRSVVLPSDADPVAVAAAANPVMSSWLALRRRIAFQAGQDVLVLGATGNAGRLAVQVAKHFGAREVIAAGRDRERLATLPALGATQTVLLDGQASDDLTAAARDVDVVLDYLWGDPAARAMTSVIAGRRDRGKPVAWIQIGAVAGPTAAIASAALRAARLQLVGSGQGSVAPRDILAELGDIAAEISRGTFAVHAKPMPLADVERAWGHAPQTLERIVLTV